MLNVKKSCGAMRLTGGQLAAPQLPRLPAFEAAVTAPQHPTNTNTNTNKNTNTSTNTDTNTNINTNTNTNTNTSTNVAECTNIYQ